MEKKIKFLSKTVSEIDPLILSFLATIIAFIYLIFFKKRREIISENIIIITGKENKKLVYKVFRNIILNIIEFLRILNKGIYNFNRRLKIEGVNETKKLLDKNSVVLITGHVGTWDIAAKALAGLGCNIAAVAEFKGVSKAHYEFMKVTRGYPAVKIFPLDEFTTSSKIINFLKKDKGILALLGDRDINNKGKEIIFFNKKVKLPIGPAFLSARLDLPVALGYLVRYKDWHYKSIIYKPIEYDINLSLKKKMNVIQKEIVKGLEDIIKKFPDQWLVFYPPWRMNEKET